MSDSQFFPASRDGIAIHPNTGDRRADNARDVQRALSGIGGVALRAIPTWDDGRVPTPNGAEQDPRALSGGRGRAPRGGDPNGGALRAPCGRGDHAGPRFDLNVPPNGYAWWYIDGLSADGERAISIIAFIGSVFSPWYRWSGRKDPANHCCINVATYGRGGRWTMTDRGRSALKLSEDTFTVGPSSLHWDGDKLIIDINEISWPHCQKLSGQVIIRPRATASVELPLKDDGSHIWRPFAPSSDIEVRLNRPGWNWDGHGYFDANFGTAALEDDFSYWTWGRFPVPGGSVTFYDADRRDGSKLAVAVRFDDNGTVEEIDAPPLTRFGRSRWLVRRDTRADGGYRPREVKMMLDAPFYSRSAVRTKIFGHETVGVHEALDLNRFASPLLKPVLACKVPRRARWP